MILPLCSIPANCPVPILTPPPPPKKKKNIDCSLSPFNRDCFSPYLWGHQHVSSLPKIWAPPPPPLKKVTSCWGKGGGCTIKTVQIIESKPICQGDHPFCPPPPPISLNVSNLTLGLSWRRSGKTRSWIVSHTCSLSPFNRDCPYLGAPTCFFLPKRIITLG